MKKLLLVLLFVPLVSFGQDAFSNGYKAGYKKGYCLEDINCIPPIPPVLTISKPGFSTYSDGYARGVSDGKKAKSSNTVKRKSGQNALISGARDLGRSNIPTYTPNTNSYSASTRKSPSNQYTQTRSTNSDLRTLKYLERQRHKNNLKIIKLKEIIH